VFLVTNDSISLVAPTLLSARSPNELGGGSDVGGGAGGGSGGSGGVGGVGGAGGGAGGAGAHALHGSVSCDAPVDGIAPSLAAYTWRTQPVHWQPAESMPPAADVK